MTMYMVYRKEQNAYSNMVPKIIGIYFDKEVAKERMKVLAKKFVEEENMGLKIREEHENRIILASVGTVVELCIESIDSDPTGSPWLIDE